MSHLAYVAAAYGITLVVLAGLACWIVFDQSAQKRAVEDLQRRGVRRRSEQKDPS